MYVLPRLSRICLAPSPARRRFKHHRRMQRLVRRIHVARRHHSIARLQVGDLQRLALTLHQAGIRRRRHLVDRRRPRSSPSASPATAVTVAAHPFHSRETVPARPPAAPGSCAVAPSPQNTIATARHPFRHRMLHRSFSCPDQSMDTDANRSRKTPCAARIIALLNVVFRCNFRPAAAVCNTVLDSRTIPGLTSSSADPCTTRSNHESKQHARRAPHRIGVAP